MAIRFVAKEPDPKPAAEKLRKQDAAPVSAAADSAADEASQSKAGRSKAKKPAKSDVEKDEELF